MTKSNFNESYFFSYILTFVGGYLGAYSYVLRGGVFASAQTGNLILLGINFANGNFATWYHHIVPIIVFSLGIILAEHIKTACKSDKASRRVNLSLEIATLAIVAFIPVGNLNLYANIGIAFGAALQTQTFRQIGEHVHMTTMCTGNIRGISEYLYYGLKEKNGNKVIDAIKRIGVIVAFVIGVVIGAIASNFTGAASVLFAVVVLGFVLLSINK